MRNHFSLLNIFIRRIFISWLEPGLGFPGLVIETAKLITSIEEQLVDIRLEAGLLKGRYYTLLEQVKDETKERKADCDRIATHVDEGQEMIDTNTRVVLDMEQSLKHTQDMVNAWADRLQKIDNFVQDLKHAKPQE